MAVTKDFQRFQYSNVEISTKQPCQNLMSSQIEWGVKNRPITKDRVWPPTTSSFEKLILVEEPLKNSYLM